MIHTRPTRAFHAMAKPSGPACNLRCTYCFYLEKARLYPQDKARRMSPQVLEEYIRQYISSIPDEDEIAFTWQGGEPTLAGLDFFRRAVALQERYAQGRRISNSFQTNGLLLNQEWCDFLAEHDFLVGLSLDGPSDIHDEYRRSPGGHPTHKLVMRALHHLQRSRVRYNALACVNRNSSKDPLRVYKFLRQAGVEFIQFMPVVERLAGSREAGHGLLLHGPSQAEASGSTEQAVEVTEWSVRPEGFGRFLTAVFDHWINHDVGKIFVMNFEWALASLLGKLGAICHNLPTCGRSVIVEHNGDVYACDHYVYPEYHRGNILRQSFASMLDSPEQEQFGRDKFEKLCEQCRQCKMLRACWGGCPKHRFSATMEGKAGLNYLCPSYQHFFGHILPYLQAMRSLMEASRPVSDIMQTRLIFASRE